MTPPSLSKPAVATVHRHTLVITLAATAALTCLVAALAVVLTAGGALVTAAPADASTKDGGHGAHPFSKYQECRTVQTVGTQRKCTITAQYHLSKFKGYVDWTYNSGPDASTGELAGTIYNESGRRCSWATMIARYKGGGEAGRVWASACPSSDPNHDNKTNIDYPLGEQSEVRYGSPRDGSYEFDVCKAKKATTCHVVWTQKISKKPPHQ